MRLMALLLVGIALLLTPATSSGDEVYYEEDILFAGPSGIATNHFKIHVSAPCARLEESGGRILLLARDKAVLQRLDTTRFSVADLAAAPTDDPRVGQMRESMQRLEGILRRMPAEQAEPLRQELTELRRALRDTMRGILPWSPCTSSVADFEAWALDAAEVERGSLRCRRLTRTLEAQRTREMIVVPWSSLPGRSAPEIEPMSRVEAAWMSVLGASDAAPSKAAPAGAAHGFILEERESIAGRLLWEVIRTPPVTVAPDSTRYEVPPEYTSSAGQSPLRPEP